LTDFLARTDGLKAVWRGKKYEDRFTQVYLLVWQDLASSHAFILSSAYQQFSDAIQPALNGRHISWAQHGLIEQSDLSDLSHLKSIIEAPVIEVALTKVVEGHVAAYYKAFRTVVGPILDRDPGCDGWWISPQIENPQHQILLINWKSVDVSVSFLTTIDVIISDPFVCSGLFLGSLSSTSKRLSLTISAQAHHEDYEKAPEFQMCIDALRDHYGEFVVPTHIVGLTLVFGSF
jgi:quinol monooxygenase YgiN